MLSPSSETNDLVGVCMCVCVCVCTICIYIITIYKLYIYIHTYNIYMYIYTIYVYLYTQCIYTYVYTSHPLDPNWTLNQWGVGGRIEHGAHVWIFQGDPGGGRCPRFPGLSLAMCVHISTSAYMYIPKSVGCTYMCPSVYMYIRNLYVSMCEPTNSLLRLHEICRLYIYESICVHVYPKSVCIYVWDSERERETNTCVSEVCIYIRARLKDTHTHIHTQTHVQM